MADPFIGEIYPWGLNFAVRGFAFCDGQILAISQFSALYAVIGTTYGGNGSSNFALPDLEGRSPFQFGAAPGLSYYPPGVKLGTPSIVLSQSEIPEHNHQFYAQDTVGTGPATSASFIGDQTNPRRRFWDENTPSQAVMDINQVGVTGKSSAHENRQPLQVITMQIAFMGVFPSRP